MQRKYNSKALTNRISLCVEMYNNFSLERNFFKGHDCVGTLNQCERHREKPQRSRRHCHCASIPEETQVLGSIKYATQATEIGNQVLASSSVLASVLALLWLWHSGSSFEGVATSVPVCVTTVSVSVCVIFVGVFLLPILTLSPISRDQPIL